MGMKERERKERILKLNNALKKLFPRVKIALKYRSNWELLVAVVLSAQSTDKQVNKVTEKLFKKYKKFDDYLKVNIKEFEQDIKSTGFYHNKAKNILASAKIIKKKYKGRVPNKMEELTELPGVARKTANIVLGNAFGIVEGIAVDTHVRRFALKFDLTDSRDPNKIEQDLIKILPKRQWMDFTYRAIEYGRQICPARKHECKEHVLSKIYPKAVSIWPKAK
ncbi:MAG: endonuclease III [Candidatus Pacebacteria bacterium]|jgi:endonuclease-3|nr:endonuclease III [Candidatus Paceibacterota bacterium]|tara:strand:- start:2874 stop:3539 length:666 start_codon:yes stop_codon:yes gene_type:complete